MMKKLPFVLLFFILTYIPIKAEEKLLVLYVYSENSPAYQKIHDKILKDKYLSKRIKKSFNFIEVSLKDPEVNKILKRYNLEKKESVHFINPATGTVLYSVTDLSQPCKCANLINYFSRNLHKKGIDPEEYLIKAEKIGAYQVKTENSHLF
ncbi:hypothetical protein [Persephonella sp.]